MEDLTGRELGPYRITAALGEGGMAAVYKAYHAAMDRHVALKILSRQLAGDPEFSRRFEQEVRLIARLQHPHILPVHDFGEADGYTYLVMPCVEGGTLAARLQGRPGPPAEIRRVVSELGSALDYAHARGVIHRDVKPGNVLLDEGGNCLLTDFGLAKMVEGSSDLTRSGRIMGTPAYMSPEQGLGEPLDRRTDVYSLGVILYELATGRTPFEAESPLALVVKHVHDPLPPPSTVNPAVSDALDRVIRKALAKDPRQRYQTAGELVMALRAAIPETTPDAIAPDATTLVTTDRAPRPRLNWTIAAAGLVLFVALAGTLAYRRGTTPSSPLSPFPPSSPSTPSSPLSPSAPIRKVCYESVFEPRGGSMDELAWNGIRSGAAQYGAEATYLVATRSGQRGPEPHLVEQDLQKFVSAGCDLIATAGFTVGDAAATTAKANPTRKFLILDFDYDPPIENVSAYLYATDQAAFLAGYVAAAVTKTGRVGTFGGFQMPPVEAYMDGFALGVAHYNQKRGASRRVLGWDVASRTGYFANDFVVEARGAEVTSRLLAEGADIVFPVAGLASLGALDPVLSRPGRYVIGVDTDWVEAYPDKASVILTSVEKRFNLSAISAIKALAEGRHEGRTRIGTIANGEVGIAPFHQLESLVSEDVRDDLGQIKTDIITGKIRTRP